MGVENLLARLMRDTMRDIKVELDDEFQMNFRREAFFNDKWKRRAYNNGSGRKILQGSGDSGVHLSQIASSGRINGNRLIYSTTLPYAAIHNEGGIITVTAKMKRYFWAKYIEANGSFSYKQNGKLRSTQKQRKLSADSEFYKAMALKKEGSKIKIPKRQFIGMCPELNDAIIQIITDSLKEFMENEFHNYIQYKKQRL